MGKVKIENLSAGMLLAADIHDRSGRLLLGGGTELCDRHLYILRTWGVTEVDAVGEEECVSPLAEAIPPHLWEAMEEEVSPIFRFADKDHPAVGELMRLRILREATHGKN